jgi:hypothetical protein
MVWICEACGYYCPLTWDDSDAWAVDSQCTALAGMATVALVRSLPLRTVCVHPDGSGSWGGAEAPRRGTVESVSVTPERAAELLSLPRAAEILDVEVIEAVCWITLAGPLAANWNCYVRGEDCRDELSRTLDALSDLPEGHPLRVQASESDEAEDIPLRWLQGEILTLLERWVDGTSTLSRALREAHWLSPAAMKRLWDEW